MGNESTQKLPFVDFFFIFFDKNTLSGLYVLFSFKKKKDCMLFLGHIATPNAGLLMQPFFLYQRPFELSFALLSVLATNHARVTIVYLCIISSSPQGHLHYLLFAYSHTSASQCQYDDLISKMM